LFQRPTDLARQIASGLTEESAAFIQAHPRASDPLVSVIIPCLNVEPTITPVLKALQDQTYKNFEVIINLDDKRTKDQSAALIRVFSESDPRFKLIFDNHGMAQGRNAGRAASSGAYLFNLDADLACTPTVLEEAVTRCEVLKQDILVCPELSVSYNFWGECRQLEKIGYLEDPVQESSGRFMRRKVAETLAGADENLLAGEDYDYFLRAKAAGFVPGRIRAISWHHELWTLRAKAKKLYRYGRSFHHYLNKYPSLGTKQFFFIRRAYIVHWKMWLAHPRYLLGTLWVNAVLYSTCGWGLGLSLLEVGWNKLKTALGGPK
jgi:glycosyltransferase involved in cell wall biosynthesis